MRMRMRTRTNSSEEDEESFRGHCQAQFNMLKRHDRFSYVAKVRYIRYRKYAVGASTVQYVS